MSKIEPSNVEVFLQDPEKNAIFQYPDNFIQTSKYNILTFIPMNLFEQFRKVSNAYFLLNMIISLIPGVSPISPATAVMPLLFVLLVAALKDGVEDYHRHQADHKANSAPCSIVRNGALETIPSRDIEVGDVLKVHNGEEIRADLVLLNSSLPEGTAYIETAQLDGETNVKARKARQTTVETLLCDSDFKKPLLKVICERPMPSLLMWKGVMHYREDRISLGIEQFLYRGAVLRNTEWVYGLVVYAGVDTKLFRNLRQKPPKFSMLDKKLNKIILLIFLLKHILVFALCGQAVWWNEVSDNKYAWYIASNEPKGALLFGWRYLSYFILLSYMIPISLFVTLELCKAMQSVLMSWDIEMTHVLADGTVQTCRPKTSNLNEQLALVQYVFTDKTGTLTENVMNYVGGSIMGIPHDDRTCSGQLKMHLLSHTEHSISVCRYLTALAVCNCVMPFVDAKNPSEVIYEAQSPDEIALVHGARNNGVELRERTSRRLGLRIAGPCGDVSFEILAQLEFTAERKMMSVVLRTSENAIIQFTKGADSAVVPRLLACVDDSIGAASRETSRRQSFSNLVSAAQMGLRTLVVGYRYLSEEEFTEWNSLYQEALCDMEDRKAKVHDACLRLEHSLELVGTTSIEDKLQNGVPDTIGFLLRAGIVVWMLTGDKRETAMNVAASCGLLKSQRDSVEHLDITEVVGTEQEVTACHGQLTDILGSLERNTRVCLVVDGQSLQVAMDSHLSMFMKVARRVKCALCCRLTPLQKADVVRHFQDGETTALAIGDGANDVSMIQEGRVGIGIMGLEGSQAELASDYAIPRFRHLKRLLFVHGRFALYRNASCICYSLYKNIVLAMCQLFWAPFCGFSAETLFNEWLLANFNMIFSSLTPLALGMFEKDLPEHVLESDPTLYGALAQGLYFDRRAVGLWVTDTFVHSVLIYFLAHPIMVNDTAMIANHASSGSTTHYGLLILTLVIFTIDIRAALLIRWWTIVQVVALVAGVLAFILFVVGFTFIQNLWGDTRNYWALFDILSVSPVMLMMILLIPFGAVIVQEVGGMCVQRYWFPTQRDLAQCVYNKISKGPRGSPSPRRPGAFQGSYEEPSQPRRQHNDSKRESCGSEQPIVSEQQRSQPHDTNRGETETKVAHV